MIKSFEFPPYVHLHPWMGIVATVISFIFVGINFGTLVENEMFVDIWIHSFNTC